MRDKILEHGPKIRRIVLISTLILVVLFFLRGMRDPFNVPKLAILFLGTGVALMIKLAELLQGSGRRGLDLLIIPAGVVALPLSLSWAFSDYKDVGLLGEYGRFQGLVPYLVTILFAVLVADAFQGDVRSLVWGYVAAATFVGGYSLMQAAGLDPFQWSLGSGRTFAGLSSTGNPNFTGGLLGMAMPLLLGLWLTERSRYPKVVPWCAAMVVGGWLWAQSQGGWGAGIGGVAVTASILLAPRIPFGRLAGWMVAGAVFAVNIGAAAIGNALNLGFVPLTARLRGEWWVMAANSGMDNPLFGNGPDTFIKAGMAHRTLKEALMDRSILPDTPHSVFMWFFACAGFLGAAGFVALMVWVVLKARDIGTSDTWPAAFLGASVAYFIQAFVSIDQLPLRVSGWALFGGLAAAFVPSAATAALGKGKTKKGIVESKKRKRNGGTSRSLRWAPALIPLVLLMLAAGWYSVKLVLSDIAMRDASLAFDRGDYEGGSALAEEALDFRSEQQYEMQYALMLGDAGTATKNVAYFEEAEFILAEADTSSDIRVPTNRAHIREEWMTLDPTRADGALADYQRAHELDPFNPLTNTNLADFLVRLERGEEALAIIEPFARVIEDPPVGVEGEFGDVYGSWAMALAASGEIDKAEAILAKTIEISPEDRHIEITRNLIQANQTSS